MERVISLLKNWKTIYVIGENFVGVFKKLASLLRDENFPQQNIFLDERFYPKNNFCKEHE